MKPNLRRLRVRRKRCKRCLYGKRPIPSPERVREIQERCARDGTPFECHEGTMDGSKLRCRGWFCVSQHTLIVRLAKLLDLIDWIDS